MLLVIFLALYSSDLVLGCADRPTCRECIALPECVWCSEPDFAGARCLGLSSNTSGCNEIQNPLGAVVSMQGEISSMQQLAPSSVELELRVGEPQSFTLTVTPAANYPLDLYILMDLSTSMSDDLEGVRMLTTQLANTLGSITNDFQVGFGSFIEKPLLPFIDPLETRFAVADYSFRHALSLTNDITALQAVLQAASVFGNLDAPEAMLEGLLQVVVCTDLIGWRTEARKLVLVITDNTFHIAGDGKLAGLVRPHDGQCYVPTANATEQFVDYQMWGVFDYPSIGQVRAKLQENDIVPIFGATTEFLSTYQALVREIEGSFSDTIAAGAANFLEVIERSYNASSQTIELIPDGTSEVTFNFSSNCGSTNQLSVSACGDVQTGQTVSFNVELTLMECSTQLQNGERNNVSVRVPGLGRVVIGFAGVCSCDCEEEAVFNSSAECSGAGDFVCGVCQCQDGLFGERCQCDSPEAVNRECLSGGPFGQPCFGRGSCECGECICNRPSFIEVPEGVPNPMYFGAMCECDNFNCMRNMEGVVCSGRGACMCGGECRCNVSSSSFSPYRGQACECPPASEVCVSPNTTVVCSGRGRCGCTRCECEDGFGGDFCSISTAVEVVFCDGSMCVECAKNLTSSDCENCSVILITPVTEMNYEINGIAATECFFIGSDNCEHTYFTIGNAGPLHAETTRICGSLPIPIWSIVVIVLGGLILLGVLLLILAKLCIVMLDRREYRRWEREQGQWDHKQQENPLYHTPRQHFENVAYHRNTGKFEVAAHFENKHADVQVETYVAKRE